MSTCTQAQSPRSETESIYYCIPSHSAHRSSVLHVDLHTTLVQPRHKAECKGAQGIVQGARVMEPKWRGCLWLA